MLGVVRFRVQLCRLFASVALVLLFAGGAAAANAGFVYALQQVEDSANQIHGFRLDSTTGALTPLAGFPIASGGTGTAVAYSETIAYVNGRLYVLNVGDDTLTVFAVNQLTGALTMLPFGAVALGTGNWSNWSCVSVHPSGSPVVVGEGNGFVTSLVVTATTATIAPGSPFTTNGAPTISCTFSRDGSYVYAGGNSGDAIAGFSVDSTTGVLTALPGSPFNSGGASPLAYATDSAGRLFSVNWSVGQVRAFTTAAGVPTGVTGNPFASGLSEAIHGVLHPSGFYLVADRTGNRVGVYQISGSGSATTLTAVKGSPFASGGSYTNALALTPDGGLLVAASTFSRNLTVFQVDSGTGSLTSLLVQAADAVGTEGIITGVALAPTDAGFVYALRQIAGSANQIYGFRLDSTAGALTPLAGFPIASGGTGGTAASQSEMIAYVNGRLYVLNDGDRTLSVFAVNPLTGALTMLPFGAVALGTGTWSCVAVHPSGSPVIVGDRIGSVTSLVVTATTAAIASGSPFTTGGAAPYSCTFSRDGSYVYTGGGTGASIAGFSVNPTTGILTALPGSPFNAGGPNPAGYATDRGGRLFSVNLSANQVRVFTTAGGVPTAAAGNPFSAGGLVAGVHGVLHPSGFYLVADRGDQVGVYRIGGSGSATTLTGVTGSPFASGGSFTNALALSPGGVFLFAANRDSRNLTLFQMDPGTGHLTSILVQAANTLGATGKITGLAFASTDAGFVYALRQIYDSTNQIYGFRLDSTTGALTPLAGFPIGSGGTGMADADPGTIAYVNGRLYVLNDGDDTLTVFAVNQWTGALTMLPFGAVALGTGTWGCVTVHPSGSPVVVADANGFVTSLVVTATTASIAPGSPFTTSGAAPSSCAFSRDGSYVYAGGGSGAAIAAFSVDSTTGVLTALPGSPFNSGGSYPRGYATDGSGRLFSVNAGVDQVRVFTTSAGVPAAAAGNPFSGGGLSIGVYGVVHPSGFYMVADRNGSQVGVYQIGGSGSGTTLTGVTGSPFVSGGALTDALALTPDGGLLVAANLESRNLTVFQVDPGTGHLTSLLVQAADTLGTTGTITGLAFAKGSARFTDDPLAVGSTPIKAAHLAELRERIDAVRAALGLGSFAWGPAIVAGTTTVQPQHVLDLREALRQAYVAAGKPVPVYTGPTPAASVQILAVHITELRSAITAIE